MPNVHGDESYRNRDNPCIKFYYDYLEASDFITRRVNYQLVSKERLKNVEFIFITNEKRVNRIL